MRKVSILAFVILTLVLFGSCVSLEPTPASLLENPFSYVVNFQGMDKAEIYKLSKLWIAETFNSAEAVITYDDEESGVLKGTGRGREMFGADMFAREFTYNISIYTRDEKAKIEFSGIKAASYISGGYNVAGAGSESLKYKGYFDKFNEYFGVLKDAYVEAINTPILKSDW